MIIVVLNVSYTYNIHHTGPEDERCGGTVVQC